MQLYVSCTFIAIDLVLSDWCQDEMKRGKANVSWEDICFPKHEGGLGIRKLHSFKIALMSSHIWKILTNKETLWVRWIHAY